jgi:tetratricopeptide (TPR) repeat protein
MPEVHYDRNVLSSFLLGHLDPGETREVVRHLLTGCESCRQIAEFIWDHHGCNGCDERSAAASAVEPIAFDSNLDLETVFERVRSRELALEREKSAAPLLCEELLQHPAPRQLMLVRNSARFQTWGVCESLLDLSFDARFHDADRTEQLAALAVAVTEELPENCYGESLVADLRARAWAHLGNAQRIRGDFRNAEESLQIAQGFLELGTGDPLELATLLSFYASLRSSQGRYDEAARFSDRIIAIYERAGDRHWTGVTMAEKGLALDALGRPHEAIRVLRQALDLMDPSLDPRGILATRHNLIYALQDTGELDEALELLSDTKPLYVQLGDRLNLLRLRRLEGQIAKKTGHTALAEAAFLEARNGFIAARLGLEAAGIALELAALYLSQGRTVETRELASQLLPVFQAADLHDEALAALLVFQRAAQAEVATVELAREILAYFEQAKDDPELAYRPSARFASLV